MYFLLRLILLLCLVPLAAGARLVTFPKDNFSIDVPREWKVEQTPKVKADWGRLVVTATGPAGRFIIVGVQEMPGANPQLAQAHIRSLQIPAHKQGWKISEMRETLIDSVPFYLFTITRQGLEAPDVLLAMTFTKKRAYTLQIGEPKGGVEDVEELEKLLHSFRLLTPMTPLELQLSIPHGPPPETGVRIRWVIAGVLAIGLVIGLAQWIILRAARKHRRQRRKRRAQLDAEGGEPAPPAA